MLQTRQLIVMTVYMTQCVVIYLAVHMMDILHVNFTYIIVCYVIHVKHHSYNPPNPAIHVPRFIEVLIHIYVYFVVQV